MMERILKASYGEEKQRAANKLGPDKRKSIEIYEHHKAKAKSAAAQLSGTPPATPSCPGKSPFWVTKHQGKAYGAFNPLPQKAPVAQGRVEVKPGVLIGVKQAKGEKKDAAAPAAGDPARDVSSKVDTAERAVIAAADRQLSCLAPQVLQLEDAMRAAAKAKAALHVPVRVVLIRAFAQVRGHTSQEVKRCSGAGCACLGTKAYATLSQQQICSMVMPAGQCHGDACRAVP
jgi:hypothetical protein